MSSFVQNNLTHIFLVKNNSQGTENTKLPSVLSTFQQGYDTKLFQFRLLQLEKFIFTEDTVLKGLRDRPILQNTDLWHNITIPPF